MLALNEQWRHTCPASDNGRLSMHEDSDARNTLERSGLSSRMESIARRPRLAWAVLSQSGNPQMGFWPNGWSPAWPARVCQTPIDDSPGHEATLWVHADAVKGPWLLTAASRCFCPPHFARTVRRGPEFLIRADEPHS